MVSGKHKSRSLRRVFKRTPGAKTVVHYEARKPKASHCANCGSILSGTPRDIPVKVGRLSKSERRPERPFGGVLCGSCMKDLMVFEAREEQALKEDINKTTEE